MPIPGNARASHRAVAACSGSTIPGRLPGAPSMPRSPLTCLQPVPVPAIAILRMLMRIAVDAHAIGRHLTGNEVYVRSLMSEYSILDPDSEFLAYVSEQGAERLLPRRFRAEKVAADPYFRLVWDLSRRLAIDKPDLIHVQYTAPLINRTPVVVTVHDVSFIENPEYFTSVRRAQLRFN